MMITAAQASELANSWWATTRGQLATRTDSRCTVARTGVAKRNETIAVAENERQKLLEHDTMGSAAEDKKIEAFIGVTHSNRMAGTCV